MLGNKVQVIVRENIGSAEFQYGISSGRDIYKASEYICGTWMVGGLSNLTGRVEALMTSYLLDTAQRALIQEIAQGSVSCDNSDASPTRDNTNSDHEVRPGDICTVLIDKECINDCESVTVQLVLVHSFWRCSRGETSIFIFFFYDRLTGSLQIVLRQNVLRVKICREGHMDVSYDKYR